MRTTKCLVYDNGGTLAVIHPDVSQLRPAVVEIRKTSDAVTQKDGTLIEPVFESIVTSASETEAEFFVRLVANIVPKGSKFAVVEAKTVPKAPAAHLAMDWALGTLTISPAKVLEKAKADAVGGIRRNANRIRRQIAGTDDAIQIAAWANKATVARRFAAGTASEAEIASMATEAQLRGKGETPQQLAGRILIWSELDATAAAMADAVQKQAETAIMAAPNAAALKQAVADAEAQAKLLMSQLPQPPADMIAAADARFAAEAKQNLASEVTQIKATLSALGKAVA